MGLRIVKLEDYGRWAVIDSVYEAMLKPTFDDHIHALLFLAWVDRSGLKRDEKEQSRIAGLLRDWLDEVAPPYKHAPEQRPWGTYTPPDGARILPEAWAKALIDTSYYDEESLARPLELTEDELIEYLESPRAADTETYLFDQFELWSEEKDKAAK